MGKKEDKAERERLKREQEAANQQLSAFITKNSEMSPYQKLREEMLMGDLNYFNQDAPDYSKGPKGLAFADTASREAQARRAQERTGTGLIQMGSQASNPQMIANIREHQNAQFGENSALAYTDALNQRRAEALGSVIPMAGARNQFVGNVGGLMSNRAQISGQNYSNFRPQQSPWWQLALAGVGAAGQLGSAWIGRPR